MIKPFLFRPKPAYGETISSYIQRVSYENFIMPTDIWRLFSNTKYPYHQSCISAKIDINPFEVFDIESFENRLLLSKGTLEKMSLLSIINSKIQLPQDYRSYSSILLRKFFETTRRYCPICLEENKIYKLIWQIKSVDFCSLHKIPLANICPNCSKKIHLLDRNGNVGFCPYCGVKLTYHISDKYSPSETEDLLIDIWDSFFDLELPQLNIIKNLSYNQTLAIKLLFFLKNYRYNSIKMQLLKIARENTYTSIIHVDNIINLLLKTHTSFSNFINTDIPYDFINNIYSKNLFDENTIKFSFLLKI